MSRRTQRPYLDPKIFISKPYIECKKCKNDVCFGVLRVHSKSYTRKCIKCEYTESSKLPEIRKKIVYLDQFVISEMMKAVNDKLGKKSLIDPFYVILFEKLEILSRAQLIVCPDSTFHKNESLSSSYYDALKRMYEHLSNGATFYDPITLHRFQIQERYKCFRNGTPYVFEPVAEEIIHSHNLHGWRDGLRISVDFPSSDEEIIKARDVKNNVHKSLSDTFDRWKTEKNRKLMDWFKEEGLAFGKGMVMLYLRAIEKQSRFTQGDTSVTMDEVLRHIHSEASVLYPSLMGHPSEDQFGQEFEKVTKFLLSEMMLEVPFNRLSAMLWACIADSAAHGGRTSAPNAGTPNDIEMIATLLPYCDAIFIDKPMFSILSHGEVKKEVSKYKAKVFSLQMKQEFLDYLDNLLVNAPSGHLDKVREVYGESWDEPYWSMYTSMY